MSITHAEIQIVSPIPPTSLPFASPAMPQHRGIPKLSAGSGISDPIGSNPLPPQAQHGFRTLHG